MEDDTSRREENIPLQDMGRGQDGSHDWDQSNNRYTDDYDNRDGAGPSNDNISQSGLDYSSREREQRSQETSFIEKSDLDRFLEENMDKKLGDKMRAILANIDVEKIYKDDVRDTYREAVRQFSLHDVVERGEWELQILDEDKKRLYLEQNVKVANEALGDELLVDPTNAQVYRLFENNVKVRTTPKTNEINGLIYKTS